MELLYYVLHMLTWICMRKSQISLLYKFISVKLKISILIRTWVLRLFCISHFKAPPLVIFFQEFLLFILSSLPLSVFFACSLPIFITYYVCSMELLYRNRSAIWRKLFGNHKQIISTEVQTKMVPITILRYC